MFNGCGLFCAVFKGRKKAANFAESRGDFCFQMGCNLRVFFHQLNRIFQKCPGRLTLQGAAQPVQVSAQGVAAFNQVDRIAVIGNCQGGVQAGNTTANYQCPPTNRDCADR